MAVATGATYTSCAPDAGSDPDWILSARRVRMDFENNVGVAEGAVVRAAESLFRQPAVDRACNVAVSEVEQLHAPTQLGLPKKLRRRDLGRGGLGWGSHVDRLCHRP